MATRRLPTEQRRRQIADAALRLLASRGAPGLTLVALGSAVGLADASILRHFKDKQAILEAAIQRFGELLDEDLPHDIEGPMHRLGAFFVRRMAKIRARPELMALAYNARLADAAGPGGAALVQAHVSRSAGFLCACVEEARAARLVDDQIPLEMWVWIIAGILRGASAGLPFPLAGAGPLVEMSPERTWQLLEGLMVGRR